MDVATRPRSVLSASPLYLAITLIAALAILPAAAQSPPASTGETNTGETIDGETINVAAAASGEAPPDPAQEHADQPSRDPAPAPQPEVSIQLRRFLVLPRVGEYKRTVATPDPIDSQIVSGTWEVPSVGDVVTGTDGKQYSWRLHQTDDDGVVSVDDAYGGYAYAIVESPEDKVMVLEAERHASVCVNGAWFTGDPYAKGWVRTPIKLKAGLNELLFHMAGPGFNARLVTPPGVAFFVPEDATLPDVVEGEDSELWAAVPVVNARDEPLADATLTLRLDDSEAITAPLPTIPPLSIYKAPIRLPAPRPIDSDTHTLQIAVEPSGHPESAASVTLPLRRVPEGEPHTRTFVSHVDGGVQSYTVVPAIRSADSPPSPAIILALHGEGIEHAQFADYYLAKNWAHIVAPSNRGEFGFDWEDWGATDALEALEDAQAYLSHDPKRLYVTGHSMGGHGAWRLGSLYPDRFAAIGPSAGWLSMWSYGGRMPAYDEPTPVQEMLLRAASPSDTLKMLSNLGPVGVYMLHGTDDAEVPVTQSRFIRSRLGEFHPDFAYFERRGAGNWWGAACCDWPQMMDFFQQRQLPEDAPEQVDFTTPDLGLSAGSYWARIEAQEQQGVPSRINLSLLKKSNAFVGTTDNVLRLSLDVSSFDEDQPIRIRLDGGRAFSVKRPASGRVWLSKSEGDRWAQTARPPRSSKSPARHGSFKSVFDNNAILVYGTAGTAEENAWSLAKARYDAQTFWYRGNGALEVVADTDFDANQQRNRNVVLYGNADTNLAWPALLSTSPIQVRGGKIIVSNQAQDRPENGSGIAALFVRPRPRSETATVGVVAGADLAGMRLTNRVRYFVSGVGLPDFTLLGPESAEVGDNGVRAAGYFGPDWNVESGDITWRDTAL